MAALNTFWQRQATALLPRTAARTPRPSVPSLPHTRAHRGRFQSSESKAPKPPPNPSNTTSPPHRLSRLLTRASRFLPHRLRVSLQGLRSAPLSHIGAFLLLHEITAVLPIFGLAYAFHALDWVPTGWVLGPWAAWAADGLRRYVPYFRRKRWFGLDGADGDGDGDGEEVLESELREEVRREKEREGRKGWFGGLLRRRDGGDTTGESTSGTKGGRVGGEETGPQRGVRLPAKEAVWPKTKELVTAENTGKAYKIGIQIAAAYTITKLLLVPRIALSLWLTPWLARGFVGLRQRMWRRKS